MANLSPVEQFGLVSTIESALGTPGTVWILEEPETISKFGADTKSVMSDPISPDRSDRSPSTVDVDSNVEYVDELKMQTVHDHIEEMLMAVKKGGPTNIVEWSQTKATLSAVTGTQYTVTAGGAISLASGNTMVFGRGFVNAANNGVKIVNSSSTATQILVTGLAVESLTTGQGASVEWCGFQGAADDLAITSGNLTSTVLDFTTTGLQVGMFIWIGGETTATKFVNAANRGLARVDAIAAHTVTLSRKTQAFVNETTTGVTLRVYAGAWVRNVAATSADFLAQYRTFEGAYAQMTNAYSYARGNLLDSAEWVLPLAGKGTIKYMWKGLDTDNPVATGSRKTGASTPSARQSQTLLNTTSNYMRLRVMAHDETGQLTDFQTLNMTINNNVKPIKVQGQLGAKYQNYGHFSVGVKSNLLMTDSSLIAAARANTQMSLDYCLRSSDGAVAIDLPSVQITSALPNFPRNEPIVMPVDIAAYKDPTLGYVISATVFPYMPAS